MSALGAALALWAGLLLYLSSPQQRLRRASAAPRRLRLQAALLSVLACGLMTPPLGVAAALAQVLALLMLACTALPFVDAARRARRGAADVG